MPSSLSNSAGTGLQWHCTPRPPWVGQLPLPSLDGPCHPQLAQWPSGRSARWNPAFLELFVLSSYQTEISQTLTSSQPSKAMWILAYSLKRGTNPLSSPRQLSTHSVFLQLLPCIGRALTRRKNIPMPRRTCGDGGGNSFRFRMITLNSLGSQCDRQDWHRHPGQQMQLADSWACAASLSRTVPVLQENYGGEHRPGEGATWGAKPASSVHTAWRQLTSPYEPHRAVCHALASNQLPGASTQDLREEKVTWRLQEWIREALNKLCNLQKKNPEHGT